MDFLIICIIIVVGIPCAIALAGAAVYVILVLAFVVAAIIPTLSLIEALAKGNTGMIVCMLPIIFLQSCVIWRALHPRY